MTHPSSLLKKKSGTDDVLILVNATGSAVTYGVPTGLQNTTWVNGITKASVTLAAQQSFSAYQYIILSKN